MSDRPRDAVLAHLSQYFAPARVHDSFYELNANVTAYFRYSKEHLGNEYFFGIVKRQIDEFQPNSTSVLFICGEPENVVVLPVTTLALMYDGVDPSPDGQWKGVIAARDERWVFRIPHKGQYEITVFLNRYDLLLGSLGLISSIPIPTFLGTRNRPLTIQSGRSERLDQGVSLPERLLDATKDFRHPRQLEQTVQQALAALGLESRALGRAGETDVLITRPFRAIVECKSSNAKAILQVNFARIKRHMADQDAQHVAVIGTSFARAVARDAQAEHVALIETRAFARLLTLAEEFPPTAGELLPLFSGAGLIEDAWVDRWWQTCSGLRARTADVLKVLDALDFTPRRIDEVRGRLAISQPAFDRDGLESALQLLASPLLEVVSLVDGGYSLNLSPETARRRLVGLLTGLAPIRNEVCNPARGR